MIKIALGLHANGINVNEPKLMRNRLVGKGIVSIIPEYASLHKSSNEFEEEL